MPHHNKARVSFTLGEECSDAGQVGRPYRHHTWESGVMRSREQISWAYKFIAIAAVVGSQQGWEREYLPTHSLGEAIT